MHTKVLGVSKSKTIHQEVISTSFFQPSLYCLFLITAFCFAQNNNKIKNENKRERKTKTYCSANNANRMKNVLRF